MALKNKTKKQDLSHKTHFGEVESDKREAKTHRFGLGETPERLDGLGDEGEGPRGGGIRVVGSQLEQVGGEDGRSEETQEDEAADGRVPHVLVDWRGEKQKQVCHPHRFIVYFLSAA